MATLYRGGIKSPPGTRKGNFEICIDAMYFTCYAIFAIILLSAFSAAEDRRSIATASIGSATINRVFIGPGKSHPLYLSIGFDKEPGSSVVCDIDVLVEGNRDNLSVGSTIRIARTTPGCGTPILVDHVPSLSEALVFELIIGLIGFGLFHLRRRLTQRRKLVAHRNS